MQNIFREAGAIKNGVKEELNKSQLDKGPQGSRLMNQRQEAE